MTIFFSLSFACDWFFAPLVRAARLRCLSIAANSNGYRNVERKTNNKLKLISRSCGNEYFVKWTLWICDIDWEIICSLIEYELSLPLSSILRPVFSSFSPLSDSKQQQKVWPIVCCFVCNFILLAILTPRPYALNTDAIGKYTAMRTSPNRNS